MKLDNFTPFTSIQFLLFLSFYPFDQCQSFRTSTDLCIQLKEFKEGAGITQEWIGVVCVGRAALYTLIRHCNTSPDTSLIISSLLLGSQTAKLPATWFPIFTNDRRPGFNLKSNPCRICGERSGIIRAFWLSSANL